MKKNYCNELTKEDMLFFYQNYIFLKKHKDGSQTTIKYIVNIGDKFYNFEEKTDKTPRILIRFKNFTAKPADGTDTFIKTCTTAWNEFMISKFGKEYEYDLNEYNRKKLESKIQIEQ